MRNNWYLENEMPIIGNALSGGKFVYAAKNGKAGWALKREYAEVGAKAIAGAEYPSILELSGALITYEELANVLKNATGKDFELVDSDDEGFVNSLVAGGFPQAVAELFLSFQYVVKDNQVNVISGSRGIKESLLLKCMNFLIISNLLIGITSATGANLSSLLHIDLVLGIFTNEVYISMPKYCFMSFSVKDGGLSVLV